MTSVSDGHIILTLGQQVGSGHAEPGSNHDLLSSSRALYRLSCRAPLGRAKSQIRCADTNLFVVVVVAAAVVTDQVSLSATS